MWRVCDAVEHIHKNGVIHNDIKDNNIVSESVKDEEEKYNPVIIDFGQSIRAATTVARVMKPTCQTLTTVDSYIAPEVKAVFLRVSKVMFSPWARCFSLCRSIQQLLSYQTWF